MRSYLRAREMRRRWMMPSPTTSPRSMLLDEMRCCHRCWQLTCEDAAQLLGRQRLQYELELWSCLGLRDGLTEHFRVRQQPSERLPLAS